MKRRGLTLAETLLTVFLLGLVLLITADLLHRSLRVLGFFRQRGDLQRSAWALQRLSLQLQGAVAISEPLLDSSSQQLQWVRVRSDLSNRLPTTLGAVPAPLPPPSPTWDPAAPAWLETLTVYRTDPGELRWMGSTSQFLLANRLVDFRCRSQGHLLEMTTQVRVGKQLQEVSLRTLIGPGVTW